MTYVSQTGEILLGNEANRAKQRERRGRRRQLYLLGLSFILCVVLNPSPESLSEYLSHRTQGDVSATLSRLVRGSSFEKRLLWSTASSGGEDFLGVLGAWFPAPQLPNVKAFGISSLFRGVNDVDIILSLYVAVFLCWLALPLTLMYPHFTVSRRNLWAGRLHTLLTNSVSHADVIHLAMNSQTLLSMGHEVSARLSSDGGQQRWHFYLLYISSALAGSAASLIYHNGDFCALGGSGALYGMWGYLVSTSGGAQRVLWYGRELSAAHALLANLIINFALARAGATSTDEAMHIGGAIWGASVFPALLRRIAAYRF
mmetsp:Transcript_6909/g.12809  ORF Transcript_6909/g.12809 Transcript_6909/m.12809 type:complete len:315 (+) Transcript_6909:146-1090(+)